MKNIFNLLILFVFFTISTSCVNKSKYDDVCHENNSLRNKVEELENEIYDIRNSLDEISSLADDAHYSISSAEGTSIIYDYDMIYWDLSEAKQYIDEISSLASANN